MTMHISSRSFSVMTAVALLLTSFGCSREPQDVTIKPTINRTNASEALSASAQIRWRDAFAIADGDREARVMAVPTNCLVMVDAKQQKYQVIWYLPPTSPPTPGSYVLMIEVDSRTGEVLTRNVGV